jgi:hypothetical protein
MTTTILEATDQGLVNTETGELVTDGGELFDPKPYTIPVPTLDGHRADTLRLAFGSSVDVDPMDNEALDHFKSLRFGQEIELHITGVVGKNGWTIKTNTEGEETVVHTLGINVHSYTIDSE